MISTVALSDLFRSIGVSDHSDDSRVGVGMRGRDLRRGGEDWGTEEGRE